MGFFGGKAASKDAIEFLRHTFLGLYGDGLESSSALSVFLAELHYQDSKNSYAISGGNDLLPKAFSRQLADKILYGGPLITLVQNDNSVTINGNRSGVRFAIEADRVVCAIPLTALKTIKIAPPFSAAKRRAVDELRYSSVSRVYLQSRTRIWQKNHPTARVTTDNPRTGNS